MVLSRIVVIARNVFLEVIRDRILYLIAIFALLMVAASFLLPEVAAGAQDKITLDLGLAGIHLLSVIVAVFVGTGLVNKEIEKRTVLVLIAKPVSRAEFLIGKHLGLSAVLAVLIAALAAIFSGGGGLQWYSVSAAERTALHRLHVLRGRATDGGSHCLRSLYQFSAGHSAHLRHLSNGAPHPGPGGVGGTQRKPCPAASHQRSVSGATRPGAVKPSERGHLRDAAVCPTP